MDPTATSQPSQQTGLNQSSNPTSKTYPEIDTSENTASGSNIDSRQPHDVPSTHTSSATSTSLGYGDTGSLKQKDTSESDAQNYQSTSTTSASNPNTEAEQMRAPGEGAVADAVAGTSQGSGGEEKALSADMDRKAAEHNAALRERGQRTGKEIEAEEKEDWTGKKKSVDLGEALGGRGTGIVTAAEN